MSGGSVRALGFCVCASPFASCFARGLTFIVVSVDLHVRAIWLVLIADCFLVFLIEELVYKFGGANVRPTNVVVMWKAGQGNVDVQFNRVVVPHILGQALRHGNVSRIGAVDLILEIASLRHFISALRALISLPRCRDRSSTSCSLHVTSYSGWCCCHFMCVCVWLLESLKNREEFFTHLVISGTK